MEISSRGYFPRIDDEELQMVLFRSQEIRRAFPPRCPRPPPLFPRAPSAACTAVHCSHTTRSTRECCSVRSGRGAAFSLTPAVCSHLHAASLTPFPLRLPLRPCSRYVEDGVLDAGICGYDWVVENGADVVEVSRLGSPLPLL